MLLKSLILLAIQVAKISNPIKNDLNIKKANFTNNYPFIC